MNEVNERGQWARSMYLLLKFGNLTFVGHDIFVKREGHDIFVMCALVSALNSLYVQTVFF